MPNFRYRALTQTGEVVSGLISAPTAAEVARRIDYLRLVPIETVVAEHADKIFRFRFNFATRARPEEVTVFTRDLALLLKAGSRLDAALELLAADVDIGRLRPTIATIRASVCSGESFADALSRHPALFAALYVALVRVGEASGALDHVLEVLAGERTRSEALRRKIGDALRYPAFLLFAAASVLVFFLIFVMPQFESVLRDFNAKLDGPILFFLGLSDVLNAHKEAIGLLSVTFLLACLFAVRQQSLRTALISWASQLPFIRLVFAYHSAALFCRNLGVLLAAAVPLTTALRILADLMATLGNHAAWSRVVDRVRHGGKLSDALGEIKTFPAMAVRMVRLGEESAQVPVLAARVAEFYEAKLQRTLDRIVGIVGPLAVIMISTIVGGLIASVMTSLLSVSQVVG
jgi:general secretion pathway protein F